MDAAKLRPLGIGEVLDAGIKVYRARFGTLVKATTLAIAPVYVLFGLAQLSVSPDDSDFGTGTTVGTETGFGESDVSAEEFLVIAVGALLVIGLVFIASQFATAIAVKIVGSAYLGEEATWRDAVRAVWARKWSIVWLSVLYGLFILLGIGLVALTFVAGFLPGLWVFVAFVVGVYLYGAWMVTVPVMMTEGLSAWQALRRSRRLMRKRWWPVVIAVVLAAILAQVVTWTLSMVAIGLIGATGNAFVENVGSVLVSTAGSALTTPFIAAVIVVAYFDLRVRKEGFDLELLARSVGVAPDDAQRYGAPSSSLPGVSVADDPSRPPFWPPPPGWRPPDA
jgi:hypothetical protein